LSARAILLAALLGLAGCLPPYRALPTTDELARLPRAEIDEKYPELARCRPGSPAWFFRSADSLIEAWGEPDARSWSGWNWLIVTIPFDPVTTWEWTRFGRRVEVTVRHPIFFGYRAQVWLCRFHAPGAS
jgi:hypothetical protein